MEAAELRLESLTMQTDWILIHKCHEFDPIISIGPEIPMLPVPEITINSPNPNDVFGFTPPTFDVTITSDNLDSTWYSLDGGITKIFFSETTGTIDQFVWKVFGDESIQIIFYTNDSMGNEAYAEITVIKSFISDLFECLSDIQELKTGDITINALNYLNQAENKLNLVFEKINNDLGAPALYLLKDVINFLLDAEKEGVVVMDIIDLMMRNSDGVVYYKIIEAESILSGEPNKHLEKAWLYYNNAIEDWIDGDYVFAISDYAKAYEKVNDALSA